MSQQFMNQNMYRARPMLQNHKINTHKRAMQSDQEKKQHLPFRDQSFISVLSITKCPDIANNVHHLHGFYRKPFFIVFQPCKVSNPTSLLHQILAKISTEIILQLLWVFRYKTLVATMVSKGIIYMKSYNHIKHEDIQSIGKIAILVTLIML